MKFRLIRYLLRTGKYFKMPELMMSRYAQYIWSNEEPN